MDGGTVAALVNTAPLVNKYITLDVASPVPSRCSRRALSRNSWESLELPEAGNPVTAAAFARQGGFAAMGHADGAVSLWDVASVLNCVRVLPPRTAPAPAKAAPVAPEKGEVGGEREEEEAAKAAARRVTSVAWSPLGFHLAVAYGAAEEEEGGRLVVWCLGSPAGAQGEGAWELALPAEARELHFETPAEAVAEEAGGRGLQLLVCCEDGSLHAVDGAAKSIVPVGIDAAALELGLTGPVRVRSLAAPLGKLFALLEAGSLVELETWAQASRPGQRRALRTQQQERGREKDGAGKGMGSREAEGAEEMNGGNEATAAEASRKPCANGSGAVAGPARHREPVKHVLPSGECHLLWSPCCSRRALSKAGKLEGSDAPSTRLPATMLSFPSKSHLHIVDAATLEPVLQLSADVATSCAGGDAAAWGDAHLVQHDDEVVLAMALRRPPDTSNAASYRPLLNAMTAAEWASGASIDADRYLRPDTTLGHWESVFQRVLRCPTRPLLLGVTEEGRLYVLRETLATDFPGPMYPVGYKLITDNEPYEEAEDEVDIVLGAGPVAVAQFPQPGVPVPSGRRPLPTKYRKRIRHRDTPPELDGDAEAGGFLPDLDAAFDNGTSGAPKPLAAIPLELRPAKLAPYSPRRAAAQRQAAAPTARLSDGAMARELLRLLPRPTPEELDKYQRARESYRRAGLRKPPGRKRPGKKAAISRSAGAHAAPAVRAPADKPEPPAAPAAYDEASGTYIPGCDVFLRALGLHSMEMGGHVTRDAAEQSFWEAPYAKRGAHLRAAHAALASEALAKKQQVQREQREKADAARARLPPSVQMRTGMNGHGTAPTLVGGSGMRNGAAAGAGAGAARNGAAAVTNGVGPGLGSIVSNGVVYTVSGGGSGPIAAAATAAAAARAPQPVPSANRNGGDMGVLQTQIEVPPVKRPRLE